MIDLNEFRLSSLLAQRFLVSRFDLGFDRR
jgi:hypothetical protein